MKKIQKILLDFRNRGLLDGLSPAEFDRLMAEVEKGRGIPWAKFLLLCGTACFIAGLVVAGFTGVILDAIRAISPEGCAAIFFIVAVGLRIALHRFHAESQAFAGIFCCAAMLLSALFLGESTGHDGPWFLLAGLFCAFVPHAVAAWFAIAGIGLGLCCLPGENTFRLEFRLMLLALVVAAPAFMGKIPLRFRHPAMLMGLLSSGIYVLEGNFPVPDLLVFAGAGFGGLLFFAGRVGRISALQAWGCIWGVSSIIVLALRHMDGNAGIVVVLEIVALAMFLAVRILNGKGARGRPLSKKSAE